MQGRARGWPWQHDMWYPWCLLLLVLGAAAGPSPAPGAAPQPAAPAPQLAADGDHAGPALGGLQPVGGPVGAQGPPGGPSAASGQSGPSGSAPGMPGASQLSSRTVVTKYGELRGVIVNLENRHLEPVEVYRGIPYAMPPVGSLRFMPPVSGALWQGVRLAEHFAPVCPQRLPDISNETAARERMPRGRLDTLRRLLPHLQHQDEDCLYLNVYAPSQVGSTTRKSPVIVFIHGESYEWNSGNPYDASVLASYGGVVVVTVNYRLGILGFLNANSDPNMLSPSNYGLMDVIAALHWLQENAAAFGGDPGSVTLMGHGTGAACVQLLLMSPAVPEGLLFHRAVLMSGSALAPGALVRDPGTQARAVARIANCSDDLPARFLLACLRERPLSALVAAVEAAAGTDPSAGGAGASAFGGGALAAFGPSVDGVVIDAGEEPAAPEPRPNSVDRQSSLPTSGLGSPSGSSLSRTGLSRRPSLPGAPGPLRPGQLPGVGMGLGLGAGASGITADPVMDLVLRKAVEARLSRYALLLGVVRAEAFLAFSSADEQFGLEADRRTRILRTFVRNTYRYHRSEILATILNEYTDWERPVQHPVNLRDETLEALSDAQVVAPVVLTADVHSNTASNKTFLYVFDYQTKYGDYQQRQGCIHGEDLAYVLGAPLSAGLRHSHLPRNFTKSEAMLSEATMNYWINFARTGNPNDPIEPTRGGRHRSLEWPPYENLHNKYIVLEPKPRIKSHYRAHRLSFWLHLVPELHRPGGEGVPLGHHQMPGDPPEPPPGPAWPLPGPGRGRPSSEQQQPANVTREAANTTRVVTADTKQRAQPQPNPPGTGEGAAGIPPPAPDPTPSAGGTDDGFAAYSTALSATVAIGCSLLLLNVLVFACVYHQRDKPHENCRAAESANNSFRSQGSGTLQSALKHKKRPVENGTPRGMCKAEHLQSCVMTGGPPSLKTFLGDASGHPLHRQHHFHLHCGPGCGPVGPPGCPGGVPLTHQLAHSHSMHQLPPPDFDDLPAQQSFMLSAFGGSATLPRPPPPPKMAKLPPLQCEAGGGGGEDQPLLSASAHNLHTLVGKKSTTPDVACGTGARGGCSGGSVVGVGPGALGTIRRKGHGQRGPGPPGQYCASQMEELRV